MPDQLDGAGMLPALMRNDPEQAEHFRMSGMLMEDERVQPLRFLKVAGLMVLMREGQNLRDRRQG